MEHIDWTTISKYDWTDFFHQIGSKIQLLSEEKDREAKLLNYCKQVFGKNHPILRYKTIDPLSFFYSLAQKNTVNQYGECYKSAKEVFELNIGIPSDSIFPTPTPNSLGQFYTHGKFITRDGEELSSDVLWSLFQECFEGDISEGSFNTVLTLKGVGVVKLTQTLFLINPHKYLPIDQRTSTILFEEYSTLHKKIQDCGFSEYAKILDANSKNFPGCSPYELNLLAYLLSNKDLSITSKFCMISSYANGKSSHDEYENFIKKSSVWTGGAGDHKKRGGLYPFDKFDQGDIILIRRGTKNLGGIGVILYNGYKENGFDEEQMIDIIWLNKLGQYSTEALGDWSGFNRATSKTKRIFKSAYPETFRIISTLTKNEELELTHMDQVESVANDLCHKNLILFGPPGTGKTYLLNQMREHFTDRQVEIQEDDFYNNLASENTWFEIIAALLYLYPNQNVPTLANHPLLVAKHNPEKKSKPNTTIWNKLQVHTVDGSKTVNYDNRRDPKIFDKTSDSVWYVVDSHIIERELPDIAELADKISNIDSLTGNITDNTRYDFVTFHQSFTYEDFVEGLKPILQQEYELDNDNGDVGYRIEKGIFYNACLKALNLAGYESFKECHEDTFENRQANFEKAQPQALFIDEINRGNISAILGELITLIEPDKRIGQYQEMWVSLPYDKDVKFGVPPNLYLIGTMNTADRSIEALDTALRRRFSFKEMMPDHTLLESHKLLWHLWVKDWEVDWENKRGVDRENSLIKLLDGSIFNETEYKNITSTTDKAEGYSEDIFKNSVRFNGLRLDQVLEKINLRIEKLIDRDHLIGHAYFLSIVGAEDTFAALIDVFYNKLIPLLQEYFYGDFGKIGLILGDQFVKRKKKDTAFANFGHEDKNLLQDKPIYRIKDYRKKKYNQKDFKKALRSIYSNSEDQSKADVN